MESAFVASCLSYMAFVFQLPTILVAYRSTTHKTIKLKVRHNICLWLFASQCCRNWRKSNKVKWRENHSTNIFPLPVHDGRNRLYLFGATAGISFIKYGRQIRIMTGYGVV